MDSRGFQELLGLNDYLSNHPDPDDIKDFIEDGKWKCNECGCCCASVDWFMPSEYVNDGICSFLGKDRKCTIYSDRPSGCIVKNVPAYTQAKACSWLRSRFHMKLKEGGY